MQSSIPPASIGRRCGLVLSAGGARGAYQAGALKAIGELCGQEQSPFDIITGTSSGAVNGAYLASRNHEFQRATRDLAEQPVPSNTLRCDVSALGAGPNS